MAVDLFANAANTTLAAGIAAGATSLTVVSSTPFPAVTTAAKTQFRVIIDSELFIVTNVTGTTWTVTPGAEGTTQAAHATSAVVTALATAGAINSKMAMIGRTRYAPGTAASPSLASTVTTLTAIDATNMVVSFAAPTSGSVVVNLKAFTGPAGSSNSPGTTAWGLLNASGGATLDVGNVTYNTVAGTPFYVIGQDFYLVGLTAGTIYSLQWAWQCTYSASAGNVSGLSIGGTNGAPALMTVIAL